MSQSDCPTLSSIPKVLSDTSKTIDVLRNDWEWEGEVLEIVAFDTVTGKGGTVSLDNNGSLTLSAMIPEIAPQLQSM